MTQISPPNRTTRLAQEVASQLSRLEGGAALEAQRELVERISRRLLAYFTRLVGPHEADDCLQETLAVLLESFLRRDYDRRRSFNAWAWLKARTVYAQWCRRREREQRLPREVVELDALGVSAGRVGASDRRLDADRLLGVVAEELGEETRELFVLYYEGDLSQDEVAEVVGLDPKTVRKRLRAAHRVIERELGDSPA